MRWTRLLRAAAHHGHGKSAEYGGFQVPHVDPIHQYIGTGLCSIMWFWIFYRAKQDGPALIVSNFDVCCWMRRCALTYLISICRV